MGCRALLSFEQHGVGWVLPEDGHEWVVSYSNLRTDKELL